VVVVLDVGSDGEREAEAREDRDDFVEDRAQEVAAPDGGTAAGERDVALDARRGGQDARLRFGEGGLEARPRLVGARVRRAPAL
jgi:hypothetical protein